MKRPNCRKLQLALANDLKLLPMARAFVAAGCRAAGLDSKATEAVVLATHEAASNVLRHAYRHLPDAKLQLECRLAEDRIEIILLDEAKPFDIALIPRLDPSALRIGGRGIFLMRSLMDEVRCDQRSQGNRLRMTKYIRPVAPIAKKCA
jgi:serine/threonine-protein kinase RsbW